MRRLIILVLLTGLVCRADADATAEWPQFHGPRRDNKSDETGLLKSWPADGPKLLWRATGIGHGYSSVAMAGGTIYTAGNVNKDTVITALDLDGRIKWTARNGPACKHSHKGTRGTPTIDGERLYHEGADGDVACLETKTGKVVWTRNILTDFNGRNIRWGLSESLLVDGDRVICTPGGKGAGIVALDKHTGKTVWVCKELDDKPGYVSPLLVDCKGVRQIVTMMARSVVGVRAETGELLWQVEHTCPWDENILTPIYHDGCIFISTRTTGSRLFRLEIEGKGVSVQEVWASGDMDNQHGGALLVDGRVYGDCKDGSWAVLEFATGQAIFREKIIGRCTATYADGMFHMLNQRRVAALGRATPQGFEIVSRFTIPEGGEGPSWAHPVVCGGRLYLRHSDYLYCYDIKAK